MDKRSARLRRAKKTRCKIKELEMLRLSVHRTPRNIYAQVIAPGGDVVVAASTLDKQIRDEVPNGGNVVAATAVGKLVAVRCQEKDIKKVAFDRSGYRYHGRILALAQAAREAGLEF